MVKQTAIECQDCGSVKHGRASSDKHVAENANAQSWVRRDKSLAERRHRTNITIMVSVIKSIASPMATDPPRATALEMD